MPSAKTRGTRVVTELQDELDMRRDCKLFVDGLAVILDCLDTDVKPVCYVRDVLAPYEEQEDLALSPRERFYSGLWSVRWGRSNQPRVYTVMEKVDGPHDESARHFSSGGFPVDRGCSATELFEGAVVVAAAIWPRKLEPQHDSLERR